MQHDSARALDMAKSEAEYSVSGVKTPEATDKYRTDQTSGKSPDADVQELEAQPTASTETIPHSVFTKNQKRYIVFMIAFGGLFSPMSASIYFPVLNRLAVEFDVTPARINLTITTYMIFQGLAPTIFGDLADIAGRRPAYLIGFTVYIGACIGIACCKSYASLLVLRCLQSSGSSGTIALASGVVADISTSSERGQWMGWAMCGPMFAPAIAPVLGGALAQFLGWRAIFWFLVISASAYLTLFAFTFPETGRNIVGNGSIRPQGWNMNLLNYLQARQTAPEPGDAEKADGGANLPPAKPKLRLPNPLHSLYVFREKDMALLLFYSGIVCCVTYDVMASLPHLFKEIYGYDAFNIGLCFLPFGAGCILAPYISGKLMDWNFRRVAKRIGFEIRKGQAQDLLDFPLEKCRLNVVLPAVLLGAVSVLCYGWALDASAPLPAPLVLIFISGMTLTGAFNVMSAMLVDLYPQAPATAQAANNLARCLMGAGATAVIAYMLNAMGRGWCFTLIAAVVVCLTPTLWILERHGPGWRKQRLQKLEIMKRQQQQKASSELPALHNEHVNASPKS